MHVPSIFRVRRAPQVVKKEGVVQQTYFYDTNSALESINNQLCMQETTNEGWYSAYRGRGQCSERGSIEVFRVMGVTEHSPISQLQEKVSFNLIPTSKQVVGAAPLSECVPCRSDLVCTRFGEEALFRRKEIIEVRRDSLAERRYRHRRLYWWASSFLGGHYANSGHNRRGSRIGALSLLAQVITNRGSLLIPRSSANRNEP